MSTIVIMPSQTGVSLGEILRKAAVPLFLFAAVLLTLLVLSWYLLLPHLTAVEVAGSIRSAPELQSYHQQLTAQLEEKEEARNVLVLPMQQTAYALIVSKSHQAISLLTIRSAISQAASAVKPEDQEGEVVLSSMEYTPDLKRARIEGDVRSVGPQSMTVLAQFFEELRSLPFVMSLESANLTREDDPSIGIHSPFSITLHLQ